MPELSAVDPSQTPPRLHVPKNYNAAHDLIQRNLRAGLADKIAYVDDERSLSFGELDARSSAFALTLEVLGVEREQRVAMCMHDSIDFPVVFLGSIKAGVVPVPINTLLTKDDYAYMLKDCRARLAVVSAALMPLIELLALDSAGLAACSGCGQRPEPRRMARARHSHGGNATYRPAETVSDEPCFWLYSSGSTGTPKGTVHVHSSLIQTAGELYARPIVEIERTDFIFPPPNYSSPTDSAIHSLSRSPSAHRRF